MLYVIVSIAIIAITAFSRLLPHPENFTPVLAIAFTGGLYLDKRFALLAPLAAMLVSDALIGFHGLMAYVYGSFFIAGMLGLWIRSRKTAASVAGGTLAGSLLFFFITNFGVWLHGMWYERSWQGLLACYAAAIPFFRNQFAGDVIYTVILVGVFEAVRRALAVPSEQRTGRI